MGRKAYVKRYKDCISHAQKWRNDEGYDSLWWRMIDLYRGKQLGEDVNFTTEDHIVVNIAFSTINVIDPSVSVNYPSITVTPTKPEDEDPATIVEHLVNWQWKHYDFQPEVRSAVKDALIIGHGWVKVGWSYSEKEVPLTEDERVEIYDAARAEADLYAAENPDLAGDLPTNEEIEQHLTETRMVIDEDQPFVERVSPFDMFVDPFATSLRDARWIAQRIYRPLEAVRKDERYKQGVRRSLKGGDMVASSEHDQRSWLRRDRVSPDVDYVTIWEYWDLEHGTMSVLADEVDECLVDPHPMPFASGHPFVMIEDYTVPDYFYPMGELEQLEALQYELNAVRSQAMQARKKFARKYLIRSSGFGPEGRQALESDEDNTVVEVIDDNQPFDNLIAPLGQIPVPPDLYNYSGQVENDMATVSGVSEYQRGQLPETRRTATEAAIISDAVTARASDKLAKIEKAIAYIARKVVAMTQEFATGEQVFQVVGADGATLWVPWNRKEIVGEFDFDVEAGSTQPQNETVRRQTAVALSQALAPFIQMGVVDPGAIARHLLQDGFGIKDASKFILPPMPMMPGRPPDQAQPPGVGGLQGAPMGGGYIDQETGNTANEEAAQPTRPQLFGQVGLAMPQ